MREPILVTGAAGFIGYHVCKRLIEDGKDVIGLDNMNDYYAVGLKARRVAVLAEQAKKAGRPFSFHSFELTQHAYLSELLKVVKPGTIIHLAAQAGVRYSSLKPFSYTDANVSATHSLLESIRRAEIEPQLIMASTGSVYGSNTPAPFVETAAADRQDSIYGATKRSAELLCATYSKMFNMRCTIARFFSVYGEWGRPDMALWKFTDAALSNKPIVAFDKGKQTRPFTHVDDVVEGVVRLANSAIGNFEIYNIATHKVESVNDMISAIHTVVGGRITYQQAAPQLGDIPHTEADTSKLRALTGWEPNVKLHDGVRRFVEWFKEYNASQWSMTE